MTTAMKPRAKRTKKADDGKTKKPTWSVVTFKKIEQWREKIGLSKSGMAEALGVTNSTYHNWRRGTTVPHPNQQQDILERIQALEKNAGPEQVTGQSSGKNGTNSDSAPQSDEGSPSTTKQRISKRKSGTKDSSASKGARASQEAKDSHVGAATPASVVNSHKVPRDDIAAITVAFISSQKKAVSQDTILAFVQQLQGVL